MLDGASCRSCPTCRKKAQDVSVKVSPSMYLSKSQKRNRVWPMNFPPRDRSDFSHLLVKGSQRSNPPRVTRCLSFFEFSIFVFLLASYPKFQIHIPIDTPKLRLRRLACHLICWALPLEISQCCAWNLNHQFLRHSMLNEGRCG